LTSAVTHVAGSTSCPQDKDLCNPDQDSGIAKVGMQKPHFISEVFLTHSQCSHHLTTAGTQLLPADGTAQLFLNYSAKQYVNCSLKMDNKTGWAE